MSLFDIKICNYWIRENVLKPIYYEWIGKDINFHEVDFSYRDFKRLLNKYGKSIENIRKGIIDFTNPSLMWPTSSYNNSELKEGSVLSEFFDKHNVKEDNGYFVAQPTLYGYYSAYDHVALSWIFGKR